MVVTWSIFSPFPAAFCHPYTPTPRVCTMLTCAGHKHIKCDVKDGIAVVKLNTPGSKVRLAVDFYFAND